MTILRIILEYVIIPALAGALFTWLYFRIFPKQVGKVWGWGRIVIYSFILWIIFGILLGSIGGGIFINQPEIFVSAWLFLGLTPIVLSPILIVMFLIIMLVGILTIRFTDKKIKINLLIPGVFWGMAGYLIIGGVLLYFLSNFISDIVVTIHLFPFYVLIHTFFAAIASTHIYKKLLKNEAKIQ